MQNYPRLRCSSGEHKSNKSTAGASSGLPGRLSDVIVRDKVKSQRSFQSLKLLRNLRTVTDAAAEPGL